MSPSFIDTPTIQLLRAAAEGDSQAARDLLPHLYEELRKLAGSWMARQTPGHTLQPTALVHEAYARLVGSGEADWDGRRHFFFAAARAMHPSATVEELRSAYRTLVRKYHPDVATDPEGAMRFQEVQEAYQMLRDSECRESCDARKAG